MASDDSGEAAGAPYGLTHDSDLAPGRSSVAPITRARAELRSPTDSSGTLPEDRQKLTSALQLCDASPFQPNSAANTHPDFRKKLKPRARRLSVPPPATVQSWLLKGASRGTLREDDNFPILPGFQLRTGRPTILSATRPNSFAAVRERHTHSHKLRTAKRKISEVALMSARVALPAHHPIEVA
jgi:hypothetical protein